MAALFAREGADVAINYLAEEQSDAEETQEAVEAGGLRVPAAAGRRDATPGCATSLVEKTVKHFGSIDVLVSNAAYQRRKEASTT